MVAAAIIVVKVAYAFVFVTRGFITVQVLRVTKLRLKICTFAYGATVEIRTMEDYLYFTCPLVVQQQATNKKVEAKIPVT